MKNPNDRKVSQRATSRSAGLGATGNGKMSRPVSRGRRIDVLAKGLTVAAEPPINGDLGDLSTQFRSKLELALANLLAQGTPFKLIEGFRSVQRQQWLYGSGRPSAKPYGRPGPILTNANGVTVRSKHQGDGTAGSGEAADCYPVKNGQVYIPPSTDAVWGAYADAVEAQGLVAGHRWTSIKDSPHSEQP